MIADEFIDRCTRPGLSNARALAEVCCKVSGLSPIECNIRSIIDRFRQRGFLPASRSDAVFLQLADPAGVVQNYLAQHAPDLTRLMLADDLSRRILAWSRLTLSAWEVRQSLKLVIPFTHSLRGELVAEYVVRTELVSGHA